MKQQCREGPSSGSGLPPWTPSGSVISADGDAWSWPRAAAAERRGVGRLVRPHSGTVGRMAASDAVSDLRFPAVAFWASASGLAMRSRAIAGWRPRSRPALVGLDADHRAWRVAPSVIAAISAIPVEFVPDSVAQGLLLPEPLISPQARCCSSSSLRRSCHRPSLAESRTGSLLGLLESSLGMTRRSSPFLILVWSRDSARLASDKASTRPRNHRWSGPMTPFRLARLAFPIPP
jgi:hypothetical protein